MHEKLTKCPNFTTFARKINKIPDFYMIYARKINKMPEFYMIFARKIFFSGISPHHPSPTPMIV